jgi:hypothetical protein
MEFELLIPAKRARVRRTRAAGMTLEKVVPLEASVPRICDRPPLEGPLATAMARDAVLAASTR